MRETDLIIIGSMPPGTETLAVDPVALAIGAWVHNMFQRTHSERTKATYERGIIAFRARAQAQGLDLDSDRFALRDVLQVWAADGAGESGATFNQRLAIVSSFYTFCQKQERLFALKERETEDGKRVRVRISVENPAELIKRAKVIPYAKAEARQPSEVEQVLAGIDTSTLPGLRDYALLAVAFTTGRRLAELAALEWRDVKISHVDRQPETTTLTWRHAKGGKRLADRLEPAVTQALLQYLRAAYGAALLNLPPNAPIWLAFDRAKKGRSTAAALTPRAIEYICERRLGQGKAHILRYSFALGMKKAGAPREVIKERMAHESQDTLDVYLPQLEREENPFSSKVAALFGLQERKTQHAP
jgi:integrase